LDRTRFTDSAFPLHCWQATAATLNNNLVPIMEHILIVSQSKYVYTKRSEAKLRFDHTHLSRNKRNNATVAQMSMDHRLPMTLHS